MSNAENITFRHCCDRDDASDYHFHIHYEMIYIEKGSLTLFTPQREYEVVPGELCVIPPLTAHKTVYHNADVEHITFGRDYLVRYISKDALDFADDIDKGILFVSDCNNPSRAKELIDKISLFDGKGAYIYIFVVMKEASSALKPYSAATKSLCSILEYIDNHAENKFSLDEIAKNCRMTRFHVCRLMKSHMGITPADYITFLKIRQAVAWLNFTSYTVKEISERLSFSSPKHLAKIFKDYFGMSPTDFRKDNTVATEKKIFLRR